MKMSQYIVYPNGNGGIRLVIPTGELPSGEVARKDVPAGSPYMLVDAKQIPADFTFFNAWEADFSKPHGVGIGTDAWFAERDAKQ
jgi:hypothetical protein